MLVQVQTIGIAEDILRSFYGFKSITDWNKLRDMNFSHDLYQQIVLNTNALLEVLAYKITENYYRAKK